MRKTIEHRTDTLRHKPIVRPTVEVLSGLVGARRESILGPAGRQWGMASG